METRSEFAPITTRRAVLFGLIGIACFHIAYTPARSDLLAFFIFGYAFSLVQLTRLRTTRQCFYAGLVMGFACFAPQLECFWRIFGAGAIALWLVLALWIAAFTSLGRLALTRLGPKKAWVLIPFLWTGLEYFRSELYYLKFSWLNPGYAFAEGPFEPFRILGIYGIGFCLIAYCCLFLVWRPKQVLRVSFIALFIGIIWLTFYPGMTRGRYSRPPIVMAGVQLEFAEEKQILRALDEIIVAQHDVKIMDAGAFPGATNIDLVVLCEYALDGEPSEALKQWCRTNQKFLIVGGKDKAPGDNFYDTAFVVSTNGEVVFKQVKSVPIQFFKDGLPAPEQKLWDSPWGKIGICICYDLSYTRVTDELVRQGAQMLIVPTMDIIEWGRHQHKLHARVAPVRAAEYGLPIFRVASSGISQGVTRTGRVAKSAGFPGDGEIIIFGTGVARNGGTRPLDRWFAPVCVGVTAIFIGWLGFGRWRRKKSDAEKPSNP